MIDDRLIAARPHYRQSGRDLYFFMSNRVSHTLTDAEAEVWAKLQKGPVTSRELGDADALHALIEARLVEVIEPVVEKNRRRILVIEPHSDDAALSIGGTMWRMRHETEFHLLTMASRSNYTSSFQLHRDCFNRSQITQIRSAEGDLFVAHLGGHYHCAGLPEATLRYNDSDWDLRFFESHEVPVAIFNNRRADAAILGAWAKFLTEFVKEHAFDEIWLPLGAGSHADHDLARNAALQMAMTTRPKCVIRLYEDVPYGAQFQEHTTRILEILKGAGALLSPWQQDVTDVFSKKLALLSIFASQFKVGSIREGVERSAEKPGSSKKVENFWTLDRLPRELPRDELWVGAPQVREASSQVVRLTEGATAARRIAIFAIVPSGRPREDLDRLGKLFPNAKFVIYAGPKVAADFRSAEDPRVELKCIAGNSLSWIGAAVREMPTSHRIVVAGDAIGKAQALRRFWLTGRTEIFHDMDHLIQAAAA